MKRIKCFVCNRMGLDIDGEVRITNGIIESFERCTYHWWTFLAEDSSYWAATSFENFIEQAKDNDWPISMPPKEYIVWDMI